MPYASIERSILRRFEQYSADSHRTTASIPAGDELRFDASRGKQLQMRVGERIIPVAVYEVDKGGQLADLWPAISFKMISESSRLEDYVHQGEMVETLDTVFNHDVITSVERSGPGMQRVAPEAEPINLTYEFRTWSMSDNEGKDLVRLVKALWPVRGALEYRQRDGSAVLIDVLRSTGPLWVGGTDPTLDEGDPGYRFFSWALTYTFEAYDDTTDRQVLRPTVRKRVVELGGHDPADDPRIVVALDAPGKADT